MIKEDVVNALRSEHKQIRDALLEVGEALDKGDLLKATKLLGALNAPLGAHFKFEEEAFYPLLRRSLGDYIDQMIEEHAEARSSARRLAEILSYEDLSKAEKIEAGWWEIRSLFAHANSCNDMLDEVTELSEEENYLLSSRLQEVKQRKIPLLDWTMGSKE